MAYAAEGQVSQSPIEGGVKITAAQYDQAVAGMMDGKVVTIAGGFAVIDLPQPNLEPEPEAGPPTVDDYTAAIVGMLDAVAKARRYDSALSLATYVASERPAWKAEAEDFVRWRDDVWDHAYIEFEKVMTGQRSQPTIAELLAELPAPPWPLS